MTVMYWTHGNHFQNDSCSLKKLQVIQKISSKAVLVHCSPLYSLPMWFFPCCCNPRQKQAEEGWCGASLATHSLNKKSRLRYSSLSICKTQTQHYSLQLQLLLWFLAVEFYLGYINTLALLHKALRFGKASAFPNTRALAQSLFLSFSEGGQNINTISEAISIYQKASRSLL